MFSSQNLCTQSPEQDAERRVNPNRYKSLQILSSKQNSMRQTLESGFGKPPYSSTTLFSNLTFWYEIDREIFVFKVEFCSSRNVESENPCWWSLGPRGAFPRVSPGPQENLCLWTEKSVIRDTNGVAESEIAWIIFHAKGFLHCESRFCAIDRRLTLNYEYGVD